MIGYTYCVLLSESLDLLLVVLLLLRAVGLREDKHLSEMSYVV